MDKIKIKVTVKFFFDFENIIGEKEKEIEIVKATTIKELIELLEVNFPGIKKITKYHEDYSVLLNGIHVNLAKQLKEKDIIDLFTIIDGG